jgi:uncharacterized protein YabN with tetrapyrrole methylase and pyrophosphatase domain
MIRRHPHVFNNDKKEDKSKIESTWEKIKEEERISKGKEGILSDIPNAFPAVCKGARYNRETLQIKYKGKNIEDVLNMPVEIAQEFF